MTTVIRGSGISIELPPGWTGRVHKEAPHVVTALQVANFKLLPDNGSEGVAAQRRMGPGDIYVNLIDLGQPNQWMLEGGLDWTPAPRLEIRRDDLGEFEGMEAPAYARRWLIVNDRAVIVGVAFGTASPSDVMFAQANQVLASAVL